MKVRILGMRPVKTTIITAEVTCDCGYTLYTINTSYEPLYNFTCPKCKKAKQARIITKRESPESESKQ